MVSGGFMSAAQAAADNTLRAPDCVVEFDMDWGGHSESLSKFKCYSGSFSHFQLWELSHAESMCTRKDYRDCEPHLCELAWIRKGMKWKRLNYAQSHSSRLHLVRCKALCKAFQLSRIHLQYGSWRSHLRMTQGHTAPCLHPWIKLALWLSPSALHHFALVELDNSTDPKWPQGKVHAICPDGQHRAILLSLPGCQTNCDGVEQGRSSQAQELPGPQHSPSKDQMTNFTSHFTSISRDFIDSVEHQEAMNFMTEFLQRLGLETWNVQSFTGKKRLDRFDSFKSLRSQQLSFKCSLLRRCIERGRLFGGGRKAVEEAEPEEEMKKWKSEKGVVEIGWKQPNSSNSLTPTFVRPWLLSWTLQNLLPQRRRFAAWLWSVAKCD